jgi:hypothetical protein
MSGSVAARPTDSLHVLPDAHQPTRLCKPVAGAVQRLFPLFRALAAIARPAELSWHDPCTMERRADAQKSIQLNIDNSNYWRTQMQIENLKKDLDAKELSEVRGGDAGNSAVNTIGQVANLTVPVAVLTGGPSNTNVSVDSSQYAKVFNEQEAGDAFAAILPVVR